MNYRKINLKNKEISSLDASTNDIVCSIFSSSDRFVAIAYHPSLVQYKLLSTGSEKIKVTIGPMCKSSTTSIIDESLIPKFGKIVFDELISWTNSRKVD